MKRSSRVFFAFFVITYFLMNQYVIKQTFFLTNNFSTTILSVISSFSYPASYLIASKQNNFFTKSLYYLSSVWIGVLFIQFSYLIIYDLFSFITEINNLLSVKTITFISLITSVYALIKGYNIIIKTINLESKKLSGKRFVHISDLHLNFLTTKNYVQKIINNIISVNPDAVFITGDFIDGPIPPNKQLLSLFDQIKSPVYYCIGNHERYIGLSTIKELIKSTKIRLLDNKIVSKKDYCIIGVNDSDDKKYCSKIVKSMKLPDKFKILLYHRPDNPENVNFDLMLCGHTHFGQIIFFTPLVRLAYKYIRGLYNLNNKHLHVSEGTGTWGPPMRLGSNNTITIITYK